MTYDKTFEDAVRAARKPVELAEGGIRRTMYDVSRIPGADRLPRALVVLLENVVRRASTDEGAVEAAWRVVSAGTAGEQGEEI